MSKITSAVQWAIQIANDNTHGYSQSSRWGAPDYDCSSLVISAWEQAGVPVKTKGATYTGNMYFVFLKCGFTDVTNSVSLITGTGLQAGDVLLNSVSHTAMCIGNGRIVHARTNEGNSESGDQSGNEIRTQNYFNYPWNYVLRYEGDDAEASTSATSATSDSATQTSSTITPLHDTSTSTTTLLKLGSRGTEVKQVQQMLIDLGYSCGSDGADGIFGGNTRSAVLKFQKAKGLDVDGIVGPKTLEALTAVN